VRRAPSNAGNESWRGGVTTIKSQQGGDIKGKAKDSFLQQENAEEVIRDARLNQKEARSVLLTRREQSNWCLKKPALHQQSRGKEGQNRRER